MKDKAVTVLSDILSAGVDVHRCAAARTLGKIGGELSKDALGKALLDEDADVRTDAAIALGNLNDPSAADALMENLINDPECDVKKAAIEALIKFRHAAVVPLLRKLVVSRTDDICWDEDEIYSEGWDSWLDLQLLAIHGLAELGTEEAVPEILGAMSDEMGQDVSQAGVEALAAMGGPGADALEQIYASGDTRLRRRIADAVASTANPAFEDLRADMLGDASPRIRLTTATSLPATDPRLLPLLGDPEGSVRAAIVRHIGDTNCDELHGLIEDRDPAVRAEVFKVIARHPARFDDEKLKKDVQKAIAGEPEAAKQAALAWIALTGPDGIKGLTHALTNTKIPLAFRVGVIEALQKAGDVSVPCLLKAAGDEARQVRLATLTALAQFAADDPHWPNAAGIGLLAALNGELVLPPEEPDIEDTGAAAREDDAVEEENREIDETLPLVPEPGTTSTLDAILSGGSTEPEFEEAEPVVLSDRDARFLELSKQRAMSKKKMSLESTVAPYLDVRRFAARLLGGVVNAEVTENLVAALDQDDADLREAALFALVQHGEKTGALPAEIAHAPLTGCLASENSETRVLAVRAISHLAGPGIEDLLHKLLSDEDVFVRTAAVQALDRRGIADTAVTACLEDEYLGVCLAAAASLARHQGADAVPALIGFAFRNDGTYRRDVGRLLGQYAPVEGALRLIEILGDDTYRRKWLVAIDALAELFTQPELPEELKVA